MDRQTERRTDKFFVHNHTSDTHYTADELKGATVLIKNAYLPSLRELSNSTQE